MGSLFEFNWIMKISRSQGLPESPVPGDKYPFTKEGYRVYPIDVPIELIDDSWTALALVVITSITLAANTTSGTFKVIKLYEGSEKELRTQAWRDVLQSVTGCGNSDSYAGIRMTEWKGKGSAFDI